MWANTALLEATVSLSVSEMSLGRNVSPPSLVPVPFLLGELSENQNKQPSYFRDLRNQNNRHVSIKIRKALPLSCPTQQRLCRQLL